MRIFDGSATNSCLPLSDRSAELTPGRVCGNFEKPQWLYGRVLEQTWWRGGPGTDGVLRSCVKRSRRVGLAVTVSPLRPGQLWGEK
jgi:hypothetical protein